jgi:hypothetical protein
MTSSRPDKTLDQPIATESRALHGARSTASKSQPEVFAEENSAYWPDAVTSHPGPTNDFMAPSQANANSQTDARERERKKRREDALPIAERASRTERHRLDQARVTTAGYSEPWRLWIVVAQASASSSSSPKPKITSRPSAPQQRVRARCHNRVQVPIISRLGASQGERGQFPHRGSRPDDPIVVAPSMNASTNSSDCR